MTRDDVNKLLGGVNFIPGMKAEEWAYLFATLLEQEVQKREAIKTFKAVCDAIAEEREACAKLCLKLEPFFGPGFAAAIRARGEQMTDDFKFPEMPGYDFPLMGYDMTMRDAFAAKAMMGMMARNQPAGFDFTKYPDDPQRVARWAYTLADAMMAERSKT